MIQLSLPEVIFSPLFQDAALCGIFPDGKILADATPLFSPIYILDQYENTKSSDTFSMVDFMQMHFEFGKTSEESFHTNKNHSILVHVDHLWDHLKRQPDTHVDGSSLISLPYPYIVPGGRFNEIYYWDSYFTMLGLKVSNRTNVIENMVNNFAYLIENAGFIPNGNRSYFLSRSQPPFFSMMVNLLQEIKQDEIVLIKYLNVLRKEYDFWMNQSMDSTTGSHVIQYQNQTINRYWDQLDTPRSEMYVDDLHLCQKSDRSSGELLRNIRCACESGWDFSCRWCEDPHDLTSIITSHILPIDLNCLLHHLEKTLAKTYLLNGDESESLRFDHLAEIRKQNIHDLFWNEEKGYYFDFNFVKEMQTESISLAGIFPLAFGLANQQQGERALKFMEEHLLKLGGLVTTTIQSGQQWDSPNGWAPLQWMGLMAAKNYGHDRLAKEIATRWMSLNENVFKNTGKMMEKYNVIDQNLESGGGEYPVQDGFGWTNGVYLAMSDFIHNHKE